MSGGLLEKMLAERQLAARGGSAAPAQRAYGTPIPASAPAKDAAPTGPNRSIAALNSGRFERWHTDPLPPEEEEAWLIAYLDMMTLLLAMLVVMLAFSEPALRGEEQEIAFDIQQPIVQAAAEAGTTIVPPIPLPHPQTAPQRVDGDPVGTADATLAAPVIETGEVGEGIEVAAGQGVVRFRISGEVLFATGDSALTPAGREVIDSLLPAFNQAPDHTIVVEGHSDNIPISTVRFPSNWELSASRAAGVVRHLEARGINPARLRASGLAYTAPIASNDTAEGRSQNRRVEIVMEAPK